MANVKVCDRCGAEIECKIWPLKVTAYRYFLKAEDERIIITSDLCPDCFKELKEFLKENK